MKIRFFLAVLAVIIIQIKGLSQAIIFEDETLKSELINHQPIIDINQDQEISISEAENAKEIKLLALNFQSPIIENFEGIQYFKNLEKLEILRHPLEISNFSLFPHLKVLRLESNELSEINIDENFDLIEFSTDLNPLTHIDLTNNSKLQKLIIANALISEVDLSNTNIQYLSLNGSDIANLDINNLLELDTLIINFTAIKNIDLSTNHSLNTFWSYACCLETLDISSNTNLKSLDCRYNCLTGLDLSQNTNLENLSISGNELQEIDLTNNINLEYLGLSSNQLTFIDLCNNVKLKRFYASANQIEHIDFSSTPDISYISIANNLLKSINLKNTNLEYRTGQFANPVISGNGQTLTDICVDQQDSLVIKSILFSTFSNSLIKINQECYNTCMPSLESNSLSIAISPNPSSSFFNLSSDSPITKIEILDLNGQIIFKSDFTARYSFTTNIENIQNGIYLIKASNINQSAITKLVINSL